jgi:hypothetical protein
MIGDAGYDVIEVDNADKAIAILEGWSDITPRFRRAVFLIYTC